MLDDARLGEEAPCRRMDWDDFQGHAAFISPLPITGVDRAEEVFLGLLLLRFRTRPTRRVVSMPQHQQLVGVGVLY